MINDVSSSLQRKCRLHNFNSRKGIRNFLGIPNDIDMKNLREETLKCYEFFYIEKPKYIKKTKLDRIKRYLNPAELCNIYNEIPDDYSCDNYRMLINIKKDKKWLKKALKKINKQLSNSLINRIRRSDRTIDFQYDVEYLHSSMRKRSYETNAKEHKNEKYVLAIDIQNFYPSIKEHKVYSFFKRELNLDDDIATIYTILCTCPLKDPKVEKDFEFGIGQGLATSPILAYMINYRMFNYIYEKAVKYGLKMTVYVDDVVFSSDRPIPQKFIDSLFSIIKQNGMRIKRKKVHLFDKKQLKKITGVILTSTNKIRVDKSKHEELFYQYNYLNSNITKVNNIEQYLYIYNLFLKFNGNFQFVNLVEGKALLKYTNFIKKYEKYFPNGIKKIKKREVYKKENLTVDDYKEILRYYEDFKRYIDTVKKD